MTSTLAFTGQNAFTGSLTVLIPTVSARHLTAQTRDPSTRRADLSPTGAPPPAPLHFVRRSTRFRARLFHRYANRMGRPREGGRQRTQVSSPPSPPRLPPCARGNREA